MSFFFFNDTATTEIYTLSLHDALPISGDRRQQGVPRRRRGKPDRAGAGVAASARRALGLGAGAGEPRPAGGDARRCGDRKSTRLNSSHLVISYAVFCLKKKKE